MSLLALVRHGQAQIGGQDYDVLSDKGVAQSKLLGGVWAMRGRPWHALYTGPRKRHRHTAVHLREAAVEAGLELPEPEVIDGFDEVDTAPLIAQALTRVLPGYPDLLDQLARGEQDEVGRTALRHVGGILENLYGRWAAGESFEGVEPYADFHARVQRALRDLMRREGRGRRILLVTSGGPISVCMRLALDLRAEKVMSLMGSLANASITEIHYTEHRLAVGSFNTTGHLPSDLISRI